MQGRRKRTGTCLPCSPPLCFLLSPRSTPPVSWATQDNFAPGLLGQRRVRGCVSGSEGGRFPFGAFGSASMGLGKLPSICRLQG
eukprot:2203008-Rhodomonas_salina.1